MPIAIRCDACQAAFRVRDEFAGKRGKCPKCGVVFLAPAGVDALAAAPTPPSTEQELPDPTAPAAPKPTPAAPARSPARSPARPPSIASPASRGLAPASATPTPTTDSAWPAADFGPLPDLAVAAAGDDRLARVASRGRRKSLPAWTWFVTAGLLLLAILSVVAYRSWQDNAQQVAHLRRDPEERRKAQGRGPRTEGFALKPVEKLDLKKPGPGAATEDIIAYVEHGIVKIDVYDEYNNRQGLGSGFVIDESGLVATNYHVVDSAVKAEVLFSDGVRYGVEGYMALRPESDVVILKLNGTPPNMRSLDLHYEGQPRTAAQVYSIGHPHGNDFQVTNGIVSRVMKTSQLPAETQAFLKSGLSDKIDNTWVSHTAQIAPGNSGGPLLNSQGEVIGVNSWVNQQINLGYAVHVAALHEMKQQMFPSPHPLKDHRRPPPTLAQVDGGHWGVEVTAEKLKQLGAELAAKKFACTSDEDYEQMQELAMSVTYVLHLRDEPERTDEKLKQLLPGLVQEAEAIVKSLAATHWEPGQIKPINQRAAEAIEERLQGAFLFGEVERLLEGQEGTRRGLLVKLLNEDRVVFLPLNDTQKQFKPAAGAKFLIAGISFGAALRYGDNPLEPKAAPIVLSETFVALPSDTLATGEPKPSA